MVWQLRQSYSFSEQKETFGSCSTKKVKFFSCLAYRKVVFLHEKRHSGDNDAYMIYTYLRNWCIYQVKLDEVLV